MYYTQEQTWLYEAPTFWILFQNYERKITWSFRYLLLFFLYVYWLIDWKIVIIFSNLVVLQNKSDVDLQNTIISQFLNIRNKLATVLNK